MKVPYLAKRGSVYQFSRRVPDDVRKVIGENHWRWSLKTDSASEAEIACRRDAVKTDTIIEQARNGTYRHFTDEQIEELALHWSIFFQTNNRDNIAHDMFPDVFAEELRLDDEEQSPIFAKRVDLERSVAEWTRDLDHAPQPGTPDWIKLIDECVDHYLTGNPELSDAWITILAEQGLDFSALGSGYIKVLDRPNRISQRNKLSFVFKDFKSGNHGLADNTIIEYQLSVDRFIALHGDLDINEITKEHVKQFRDLLRSVPSRAPNEIRALTIVQQAEWVKGRDLPTLSQAAINKNFLGVKAALNHAYNETSIFEDPHWRNPFDGFSKKPKKADNPITRFTDDQVQLIFAADVYTPKTAEKFWIPLVLYFSGARLTEISQIHVNDVQLEPIPHIVVENLEDENASMAKKLKNASSHRTIPLHRALIDLGFLDYVNAIRDAGHKHVFPNLPHQKIDGVGDLVSRDFITRFREYGEQHPNTGLNTKSLVTHSLRHTFRTKALSLPDQDFVQVAMGHYVPGVSIQVYGKEAYMMPDLLAKKVMNLIELPQLDLNDLRTAAQKWMP